MGLFHKVHSLLLPGSRVYIEDFCKQEGATFTEVGEDAHTVRTRSTHGSRYPKNSLASGSGGVWQCHGGQFHEPHHRAQLTQLTDLSKLQQSFWSLAVSCNYRRFMLICARLRRRSPRCSQMTYAFQTVICQQKGATKRRWKQPGSHRWVTSLHHKLHHRLAPMGLPMALHQS